MKVVNFATHPVQYQVPIYRRLSEVFDFEVIYMMNQTKKGQADAGFGVEFEWDIPLLEGYKFQYLKNHSENPSSSSYKGVVLDKKELDEVFNQKKPDLVILHGWFPYGTRQILKYCKKHKIKVICRGDSNLLMTSNKIKRIIKEVYIRDIIRKFDAFLYVGEENERFYHHYGVSKNKLFPALHCIDTPFFKKQFLESKRQLTESNYHLGFCGKFIEKKCPLLLLDAVSKSKFHNKIVIEMVGDGPLKADIIKKAEELNLNVNFNGFLNQSQIVEEGYQKMDFIVLPSAENETWGLVINEAMTGGIPAIVSDRVGCNKDLILEGETGFVFKSNDVIDLTEKIDQIIPILRKETTQESIGTLMSKYSLENTVQGYKNAITSICGK